MCSFFEREEFPGTVTLLHRVVEVSRPKRVKNLLHCSPTMYSVRL